MKTRKTIPGGLLPETQAADHINVTPRSLFRWDRRPELGFPKPVVINGRKYRRIDQLTDWIERHVKSAETTAA
jgi:hypothetical protein